MRLIATIAALALLLCPIAAARAGDDGLSGEAVANWRTAASTYDLWRLDSDEQAFGRALRTALIAPEETDLLRLGAVLAGQPVEIEPASLLGDWRCRTVKLGGPYGGLTIYGFFDCRIAPGPDGTLRFEKLTGSQRVSGQIYPDGPGRMVLLGAGHYGYEEPRAYGGPNNDLGPVTENRDEPGILTVKGERVLIGFPFPIFESDYDILELRRR